MPKLTLIAAMTPSGIIGADGKIPWDPIREDLRRFRDLTMGHAIIMGRKTFESIGRVLPGRPNIVVTRRNASKVLLKPGESIFYAPELADALDIARDTLKDESPFVIGGGEVYRAALPQATHLELTFVIRKVLGDTFFPYFDGSSHYPSLWDWRLTSFSRSDGDPSVEYHSFERRAAS